MFVISHALRDMVDSIVKKSGKVSIMMKNLTKPSSGGGRKVDERARGKYEVAATAAVAGEKPRVVVVTWPGVAMYLRASCLPLVAILMLCHLARTSLVVTADFWLADWSAAVPRDAANTTGTAVCGSILH